MIILKYTKYLKPEEGSDEMKPKIWYDVIPDVDEDGNMMENYREVCARLEKDIRNRDQDYSKVEIIEAGFIIHKSSLRARQKAE